MRIITNINTKTMEIEKALWEEEVKHVSIYIPDIDKQ